MEIIFVVTALAFASVLILLVLLAAAGISAAFGASFHAVFVNGLCPAGLSFLAQFPGSELSGDSIRQDTGLVRRV